eukprot:1079381-Prymnesium_polylepis.2
MPQAATDDQHGQTQGDNQCDEGHAPNLSAVADRQMRVNGIGQRGADVPRITCERRGGNERAKYPFCEWCYTKRVILLGLFTCACECACECALTGNNGRDSPL